ncbi:hypothetical protein I204_05894 [Kwoniella mangroviensis CBS 8886]|uniref:uncharacterized protein n=1 Tax=Kwoniella mangroviensis CBS 8507 TaxID=1296122 RepID=UPI00080D7295|nr:uncharacterized protein I203_07868 [Kwoniella mangroviensis CBS 8507]OCF63132.1 hypothetical protein I203_07868 [Kwoniella mangroviensis CBS 8507]OCF74044.1 hypothetical protein I204_05894 [Kwoniella mangroviensis CBS 8886]
MSLSSSSLSPLPTNSPSFPSTTQKEQDNTNRLFHSLEETVHRLLTLHLSDGLESPYVYEDLLKPINLTTWKTEKYPYPNFKDKSQNEVYDLIVILAKRIAEFLTRLSVLVKVIYHLFGLLEIIIRRLDTVERGDDEIRMVEKRLDRLERKMMRRVQVGIEGGIGLNQREQYSYQPPTPKSSKGERLVRFTEVDKHPMMVVNEDEEERKRNLRRSSRHVKVVDYTISSSDDDTAERALDLD